MSPLAVDVIVAARNEAQRVGACVTALRRQDYPGRLRVCVVDNASRDATAACAAACGAEVLQERRRGRSAARNAGLRATDGDLVAFLDAHVVVDSNWIRRMAEGFTDPRVGGCQSKIRHHVTSRPAARFVQASAALSNDRILADSVRGERTLYPWLSTANCMYRRAAVDGVGGFNEQLVACEDVELSWRVIARGYRLAYISETAAAHYDDRSWLAFVTKGFGYGRGAAQVEFLYRPHGTRTRFRRLRMARRHPEDVLGSFSYLIGFRLQALRLRLGLSPSLEPVPVRPVDGEFRPWFAWTPGVRLRISPSLLFWSYEDRPLSVIVQPSARRRSVLEGTGDVAWRLLAAERDRDESIDRIVAAYGMDATTVARDLDDLIAELVAAELIDRDDIPAVEGRPT